MIEIQQVDTNHFNTDHCLMMFYQIKKHYTVFVLFVKVS